MFFTDPEAAMALDPLFGLHSQALSVHRQRLDVLAANLANSDTPNFKARDIDFAATLARATVATDSGALTATAEGHIGSANASGHSIDDLVWRVPMQNGMDGNTVDAQIEQAKFADAAMHYQASLGFIDGRVKSMLTAITGQ